MKDVDTFMQRKIRQIKFEEYQTAKQISENNVKLAEQSRSGTNPNSTLMTDDKSYQTSNLRKRITINDYNAKGYEE